MRFTLSAFSLLNFNFSVNSFTRSVILSNCSDVVGGNTSLKASLIGVTTLINPSKTFLSESISIIRPLSSAHPLIILFLASDELFIALLR